MISLELGINDLHIVLLVRLAINIDLLLLVYNYLLASIALDIWIVWCLIVLLVSIHLLVIIYDLLLLIVVSRWLHAPIILKLLLLPYLIYDLFALWQLLVIVLLSSQVLPLDDIINFILGSSSLLLNFLGLLQSYCELSLVLVFFFISHF